MIMDDEIRNEKENENTESIQFQDIEEINTFLDSDEILVTDEENRETDENIEKREHDLIVSQDTYDLWYDKITRRRMYALARLRSLSKNHKKRMDFYDAVQKALEKKPTTKHDEFISTEGKNNGSTGNEG